MPREAKPEASEHPFHNIGVPAYSCRRTTEEGNAELESRLEWIHFQYIKVQVRDEDEYALLQRGTSRASESAIP